MMPGSGHRVAFSVLCPLLIHWLFLWLLYVMDDAWAWLFAVSPGPGR
jgi:hypothetical protein